MDINPDAVLPSPQHIGEPQAVAGTGGIANGHLAAGHSAAENPAAEAIDAFGPDTGESAIEEMMRLPGFHAAAIEAANIAADSYRGNWLANRLMNDRGRFIATLMILDLHYIANEGQGFTAAELRRDAVEHGLCSPGRITAFVAALRVAGYLQPAHARDRRLKRLVPTENFLAIHRERWRQQFALIAKLRPGLEAAAAAFDEPRFVGVCSHAMMRSFRRGDRLLDFVPEFWPLADRDAGMTMMFSMASAHERGAHLSISAMAERFSVSRAHVLDTMRVAESQGLVVAGAPRKGYAATPKLVSLVQRMFAVIFLFYIHAYEASTSI